LSKGRRRRPTDDLDMETEEKITMDPDDEIDIEPAAVIERPVVREPDMESVGRGVLFLLMCICLVAFGIPLLLISLLKSPESLQDLVILGLTYHNLVFALLLSAAITSYTCIFFLRVRPWAILAFFALSVFSCFPLIMGLRNNLTLQQALFEIPFFRSWPFFLRPGYILIEFLIPAAIVVCLILQIICTFGRKPYRFTFLLVALYLGIASFFGFSALTRAGQPSLANTLTWMKETGEKQQHSGRAEMSHSQAESAGGEQGQSANQPLVGLGRTETVSSGGASAEVDRKVQILSDKVDRILEALMLTEPRQGAQQKIFPSSNAETDKEQNPGTRPTSKGAVVSQAPGAAPLSIEDLSSNLQAISEKVERILETLDRVQVVLPAVRENLPVRKDTAEAGPVSGTYPDTRNAVQSGAQQTDEHVAEKRALEDLNKKVQVLSEKMDHVVETLGKVEGRLPGREKTPPKKLRQQ